MKNLIIIPALCVTLFAGCASTPEHVASLEQARADVQALQQDPLVSRAASRELMDARASLSKAESALADGDSIETVDHFAYLATRQAQTGEARIAEARAREQVADSEADRNRVLLNARTQEAEAAAAAARAAQADAADLQRELAELQAKQTQRGMVMTLSDVLFDTDAATLKPGADLTLDRIADFLKKSPDVRLIVEGHTDSRGSEHYNEDLSQRRAQAVRDALIAQGIQGDRIEALGRGEAFPVASNDTSAGRQQNRRVEIVFSNGSGQFAEGSRTAAR